MFLERETIPTRTCAFAGVGFVVLLGMACRAQAQVVSGRVLDSRSGTGVRTAFVEIFDVAGDRVGAGLTDGSGRYRIALRTAGGPFRVDINSLSHQGARVDSVGVAEEQVLVLDDVRLAAAPLLLEGIVVQGRQSRITLGREAVRRHQLLGGGTFLAGAVIEAASPASLTQHIAAATGLWVEIDGIGPGTLKNPYSRTGDECVIVMVNRWPLNRPGIDGGPPIGFRSLDEIPLDWIAAIEIFNDYRDVPDLYASDAIGGDDSCGIVNIWTWNSWF